MIGDELRANPYVGLRPFFSADSLYFYGRDQQTAELLTILRQQRFLAVVGSSGSGKSSLVRAGLLPSLVGGFLVQDRDRWRAVQIKPGDAPLGNLATGLVEAMGLQPEDAATLEHAIRDRHTDAIVEFLKAHVDERTNVFLLVDQFEEIFAFRGADDDAAPGSVDLDRRRERGRRRAEAADFVDLLLALAERRELPIYVALTMRTDFLGECDLFYGLPEAFNRGRYLVPRLTREQLRDAVECPALLLNAEMAPRLIDHVLNELGDRADRLPVLQHALLRTWDAWRDGGGAGPIDLAHYQLAGGIEGALNQDAEAALEGLDREVTARVFKRLTDTDASMRRVRSPARISELVAASCAPTAQVIGILRQFEERGRNFVHQSADGKADDPRVDISHESLIRQWGSLKTWVDEERLSRDQYRDLLSRSQKKGQRRAALLQDPELQIAFDWRHKERPSAAWARRYSGADGDFESADKYLDDSVAARSLDLAEAELSRRWRRTWSPLIAAVVIGLFGALVLSGTYTLLRRRLMTWVVPSVAVEASFTRVNDLAWTTTDNRKTLTWVSADAYCRDLKIPEQAGSVRPSAWRLPTVRELLDIYSPYEKAEGMHRKLRPDFQQGVSADYLWSAESDARPGAEDRNVRQGLPDKIAADFKRALMVPLPADTDDTATALCVSEDHRDARSELPNASDRSEADPIKRANSDSQRQRDQWEFVMGTLILAYFVSLYYVLALAGSWVQRELSFKPTVQKLKKFGGRNPAEVVALAARPEAVVAHHTVYASALRRVMGWTIDAALCGGVLTGAIFLITSRPPTATVIEPNGNRVDGVLVDYQGDKAILKTIAGVTTEFDTSLPPEVEFVDLAGGDAMPVRLPSGVETRGWAFRSDLARVTSADGEEWYGIVDDTDADGATVTLKSTLETWQRSRDALVADLHWRFGTDTARIDREVAAWETKNRPPTLASPTLRRVALRRNEVTDVIYPPSDPVVYLFIVLSLLAGWLYSAGQMASRWQATLGMRVAGIFITDLQGERLSFSRATSLFGYRLGSYLAFGLGLAVQPFSARFQTLHDRLAGTVVLRRPTAAPATAPTRQGIMVVRSLVVGVCVVLILGALLLINITREGAAGDSRSEYWNDVGVLAQVDSLTFNGQAASASITVAAGAPVAIGLDSSLEIIPLERCPEGQCPVGFVYGYRSLGDERPYVILGSSSCDRPAFRAAGAGRDEPFSVHESVQAPTRPGRYAFWVDFAKMTDCSPDKSWAAGSTTRRQMATILVK